MSTSKNDQKASTCVLKAKGNRAKSYKKFISSLPRIQHAHTGKKKSCNSHMYSTESSANATNWGTVSDSVEQKYTRTHPQILNTD